MIKKIFVSTLQYFGVYVVYCNVASIIATKDVTWSIDANLLPFFAILAWFNIMVEKESKTTK